MSRADFEELARAAVNCRVCFSDGSVRPAKIDIAQPRWIGPLFWEAAPRIVVMLLNPGSGKSRRDSADERCRDLLLGFRDRTEPLDSLFRHQADDMKNWGRKRFERFYFQGLRLKKEETAFANIAWCSTEGNRYPGSMLARCFERHTSRLLQILNPNVVILSGSAPYRFASRVQSILPQARLVPTLHYAHREGTDREEVHMNEVLCGLATIPKGQETP